MVIKINEYGLLRAQFLGSNCASMDIKSRKQEIWREKADGKERERKTYVIKEHILNHTAQRSTPTYGKITLVPMKYKIISER